MQPKVTGLVEVEKRLNAVRDKAKKDLDAEFNKASKRASTLSKESGQYDREYKELARKLKELEGVYKKRSDALAAVEKGLNAQTAKFEKLESTSESELEKISLEMEKDMREASELIKNFDARVQKMADVEATLAKLDTQRAGLTKDLKSIITDLKEIGKHKGKISVDEMMKKVAEVKQKLVKMEKRKEEYEGKQKETKSSLKKVWELEGKGG
jgi:chromosome segregation ATPase